MFDFFINFFVLVKIVPFNVCLRYIMNSSCTFRHDVNQSNCVLGYPVLENSILFSHQRSRFASFLSNRNFSCLSGKLGKTREVAIALYPMKLKSRFQETNWLILIIQNLPNLNFYVNPK